MSQQLQLPAEAAGKRLDIALSAETGETRSKIQKLITGGFITIDGETALSRYIVRGGEKVIIRGAEPGPKLKAPDLKVLYEDDDMMAVDKPAGLVVHLSESGRPQPTVADFAAGKGVDDSDSQRPGIVHRLDKDTSGVLLIAKNPVAKKYLQQQFRSRKVKKKYLALVSGRLKSAEATIELPIGRDRRRPTKRAVVAGSRAATSHYRVLEELPGLSLVEVKLETGRTHQIRVHFSHLGHAVAGDELYKGPKVPGLTRQFLHASEIGLMGLGGRALTIRSPLPGDLNSVLEALRKRV